jgi:hypothetical protein
MPGSALPETDAAAPHPARICNVLLGGKDGHPADREAARQILQAAPKMRDSRQRAAYVDNDRSSRVVCTPPGQRQAKGPGAGVDSHGRFGCVWSFALKTMGLGWIRW